MDLIARWNIWGQGPVLIGKEDSLSEPKCFCDPMGKSALNVQQLFDITAAEQSLMLHFSNNHLEEEPNRVQRSETEGISLRMTPVKVAEIEQMKADELIRMTSTSRAAIGKLANMAFMRDRIKTLRQKYNFLSSIMPSPSNAKKADLAKELAECHRVIRSKRKTFVKKVKDDIELNFIGYRGFADKASKDQELQHPFYALTLEAKACFFDVKYNINVDDNNSASATMATPTRQVQSNARESIPNAPFVMENAMAHLNLGGDL